jgi:adenylate cyclase
MSTAPAQNWLETGASQPVPLLANLAIGRASTNDVIIAASKASRRHASIHVQNGGEFWLIDLGSVNGTFLNGRRVFQPVRLQNGDKIDIAGEQFVFRQVMNSMDSDESYDSVTVATMPEIKAERCWLLVADIEEFTQLSQSLDAEELAVTIGRWVRESRECIERHGGIINKYLGDGYLAFWRDAPDVSAHIAAVLEENRPLQSRAHPKFRLVVHVGRVLFGGSASISEESLMGPDVNFIFRMEKVAGTLGVQTMLSEAAKDVLSPLASCTPVPGEHELKGFSGTHRFYGLVS